MTDTPEKPDNVVGLDAVRAAAKNAKPHKRSKPKDGGGPPADPPAPPPPEPPRPGTLPDDSPVKALGHNAGTYYYLDAAGQLRDLREEKHGRLHLISLFGGTDYLNATWPVWKLADDKWIKMNEFAHGRIAPALMSSCHAKGVWDPTDKVRGCGSWIEDDGALVMHCGNHVWVSRSGMAVREDAGIRGAMLYPRRPSLPQPEFSDNDPGTRVLDQLETWHFKRGSLDAQIVLGWIMHAMLGQAASWRPMMWVTGGKATGKSTMQRLVEWLLGRSALIKPSNTTQAYVYQRIGDSSLPVALDEFESKQDNRRQDDVIELMRIAASGGELGRGGSEGTAKTYTVRSCFSAFSIVMPALSPQDLSRMAIVELLPLRREETDPEFDLAAPAEHDLVLGAREKWDRVGRELRGRVLTQWPRYLKTFNAYFQALVRAGHDSRAASQFGSLGAGCDLALFDTLEIANARKWADMLPASDLAETKGYSGEPQSCLQYLLAATPDLVRGGTRETIAHYLRQARIEAETGDRSNEHDSAERVLAKVGIKLGRDKTLVTHDGDRQVPVWWIGISSTHPALARIFSETHWRGKPNAPGAWAQALRGLPGAAERAIQWRIDSSQHWVTRLMYDAVFPPFSEATDKDEIENVRESDRERTKAEKNQLV